MILEGTIEEIIFRNDDNGYTVAVLEHNEQYSTVVGKFLSINIGENVRLVGDFVTNQKYGEQFSFTSSEVVFPSTVEGIEKYLASGLIKGVGPVTAKAIVKEFKEDTLEIIEMFPERLEKIRGISKNKAIEISECIGKFKSLQNTMIFLHSSLHFTGYCYYCTMCSVAKSCPTLCDCVAYRLGQILFLK